MIVVFVAGTWRIRRLVGICELIVIYFGRDSPDSLIFR